MTSFILFVVGGVLGLLIFAIIASAILSWLFAFNVLNYRNGAVRSIAQVLEAVTSPVLRPFQRFIPPLGGVDISPIFAILVLQGLKNYLLPWALAPLARLIG